MKRQAPSRKHRVPLDLALALDPGTWAQTVTGFVLDHWQAEVLSRRHFYSASAHCTILESRRRTRGNHSFETWSVQASCIGYPTGLCVYNIDR